MTRQIVTERGLHAELMLQGYLRTISCTTRATVSGPSGAGKTTLLRALAGLEPRVPGRICVDGMVWQDARVFVTPRARRVGWVPQDALLFPHLNVAENIRLACTAPAAYADSVALFQLAPLLQRRVRHLSGGERQRVAMARALASEPRWLLLDESFSALDRDAAAAFAERLRAHLDAKGIGLVMVAHVLDGLAPLLGVPTVMSTTALSAITAQATQTSAPAPRADLQVHA